MSWLLLVMPLLGSGAFLFTLALLRKLYPLRFAEAASSAAQEPIQLAGQQLAQAVVRAIREEKRQVIEAAARREAQRTQLSAFGQAIGSEIGHAVSDRRRSAH